MRPNYVGGVREKGQTESGGRGIERGEGRDRDEQRHSKRERKKYKKITGRWRDGCGERDRQSKECRES